MSMFVRARVGETFCVTLLFGALTAAWLWPLPAHLGDSFVHAFAWQDARVNTYILQDSGNALLEHPQRPLDGRIFHPHARTLGYSENLLFLAGITLPIRARISPVALHNVLLMLGMTLSGVVCFLYLRREAELVPAFFGSAAFAFAPFHASYLGRLQLVWTAVTPLLFLCAERWLERRTLKRAAMLGVACAVSLGTCVYYTIHAILLLALPVFVLLLHRERRVLRRILPQVAVALCAVLVLVGAVSVEYARVHPTMGFAREPAMVSYTSGLWSQLWTISDRMLPWFSSQHVDSQEDVAYPGTTLLVFSALGVAALIVGRRRRIFDLRVHLFILFASLVLFFGTSSDAIGGEHSLYAAIAKHTPLLCGMRYPRRFIVPLTLALAYLGTAGLQAFGGWLQRRRAPRWVVTASGMVVSLVVLVEFAPSAQGLHEVPPPAPVYEFLAAEAPGHTVIELPIELEWVPRTEVDLAHARTHANVVNAYSGFEPAAETVLADAFRNFPDVESHAWLRQLGIDRVLVHGLVAQRAMMMRVRRTPWVTIAYEDAQDAFLVVSDVPTTLAHEVRERISRLRPREPSREEARAVFEGVRASSVSFPDHVEAIADGNFGTFWTTGQVQHNHDVWFDLTLPQTRTIHGVAIVCGSHASDFPAGLRVQARVNGSWESVFDDPLYIPVDQLFGLPALSEHRFAFRSPVNADAVRVISASTRTRIFMTVDEAWVF